MCAVMCRGFTAVKATDDGSLRSINKLNLFCGGSTQVCIALLPLGVLQEKGHSLLALGTSTEHKSAHTSCAWSHVDLTCRVGHSLMVWELSRIQTSHTSTRQPPPPTHAQLHRSKRLPLAHASAWHHCSWAVMLSSVVWPAAACCFTTGIHAFVLQDCGAERHHQLL
jgi:hypothetical protein